MKILDWLVEWWRAFYYKRDFRENIVYINKAKNIAVIYSIDENVIKIFTHGLIYNLPIEIKTSEKDYLDTIASFLDEELDSLPITNLQEMLTQYELLEDYDTCIKIRNIITSKLQNNDNK